MTLVHEENLTFTITNESLSPVGYNYSKKHEFGFTILNAFDNFKAALFSFYISNLLTILRKAAKIRGRKN